MRNKKMSWKLLRRGNPMDLKLFRARFDYYKNPRNDKEVKMVAIDAEDSVCTVAFTKSNKIVLVRQFRFGIEGNTIELPGGIIENNENPLHAGQRELIEETGYDGGRWTPLGTIQSNPVFMNSHVHQYLAVGVEKTVKPSLDEGEAIEVLEMSKEEVISAYEDGLIRHPHTLIALLKVMDLWEKIELR